MNAQRKKQREAQREEQRKARALRENYSSTDGAWMPLDFEEVWELMNVDVGFRVLETFASLLFFDRDDVDPKRHRLRLFRRYKFAVLAFEEDTPQGPRTLAYIDCARKCVRIPRERAPDGKDQALMLTTGRHIEFVDTISLAFKNFFGW